MQTNQWWTIKNQSLAAWEKIGGIDEKKRFPILNNNAGSNKKLE